MIRWCQTSKFVRAGDKGRPAATFCTDRVSAAGEVGGCCDSLSGGEAGVQPLGADYVRIHCANCTISTALLIAVMKYEASIGRTGKLVRIPA